MRRWWRGVSAGVLGALVLVAGAGCRVDQEAEVATYRKVIDLPATQPTERAAGSPLTLREALVLANRYNEDLNIEGEAYLRSIINRRRAVANFLPTVDLVPTYSRRDSSSGADDDGDGGGDSDGNGGSDDGTFDVTLSLDYTLFEGFRNINSYWRDTYLIRQRRNALLDLQESLLLDVAQVYYQILRSEASVRVLESSVAVQAERLRETRGRLDAGMARPLDVAQTEAQLAQTRTTLVTARNDVHNARALLAFLTVAEVADSPLVDAFELPPEVPPLGKYLVLARERRKDAAAANEAVAAARHDVDVAFGQYYPSVTLNVGAFLYRETLPDDRDWTALLSANLPIFSAGRIHADVREAWSFFSEALLVRRRLDRQVVQEVQTAYQDLAASEARLADLRVQLDAAEQAYTQSEQSYQAGLATNLERVAAQDALLEAQLQQSSETFDRKVFYLNLIRASGQLRSQLESVLASPLVAWQIDALPTSQPAPAPRGPLTLRPVTQPATTQPAPPVLP